MCDLPIIYFNMQKKRIKNLRVPQVHEILESVWIKNNFKDLKVQKINIHRQVI